MKNNTNEQGQGKLESFNDHVLIELVASLLDDGYFEIRNIDTHGNRIGSRILQAIHKTSESSGLEIQASNVEPDAEGFWTRMGYQPQGNNNERWYYAGN